MRIENGVDGSVHHNLLPSISLASGDLADLNELRLPMTTRSLSLKPRKNFRHGGGFQPTVTGLLFDFVILVQNEHGGIFTGRNALDRNGQCIFLVGQSQSAVAYIPGV